MKSNYLSFCEYLTKITPTFRRGGITNDLFQLPVIIKYLMKIKIMGHARLHYGYKHHTNY